MAGWAHAIAVIRLIRLEERSNARSVARCLSCRHAVLNVAFGLSSFVLWHSSRVGRWKVRELELVFERNTQRRSPVRTVRCTVSC